MIRLNTPVAPGVVAILVLVMAGPAPAHGDISSSTPEAGASLKRSPRQVRLVLAEAPAAGSKVTVMDGCGDVVSGKAQRDGAALSASLAGGQPGRWRVRLRSISSVDGHLVSERFSFKVAGKRDCSAGGQEPKEGGPGGDASTPPPVAGPEDDSGLPLLLPFILGTVVVVGLAFALRRPPGKA